MAIIFITVIIHMMKLNFMPAKTQKHNFGCYAWGRIRPEVMSLFDYPILVSFLCSIHDYPQSRTA